MYEAPTDPLSRLSQVGHRKLSWEASHDLPEYDAVVIGSGQGWLSCAAVLAYVAPLANNTAGKRQPATRVSVRKWCWSSCLT